MDYILPSSVCKGRQQLHQDESTALGLSSLTRMLIFCPSFTLVSELLVFVGKVCYHFLRYFCFGKCRKGRLACIGL